MTNGSFTDRVWSRLSAERLRVGAGSDALHCVAFSGGVDSSALLYALSKSPLNDRLAAVHVDHGLDSASMQWADHCRRFAASIDVPIDVLAVGVDAGPGDSVEARAREARYRALSTWLPAAAVLLTAHHADDQAETVLLQLLRGSGPAGVAGIAPARPFGRGYLLRPMLDLERSRVEAYARAHGIEFLDDPANAIERFDRNFLRHQVMPLLKTRWPSLTTTFARSAELAADADRLTTTWARGGLRAAGASATRLPLAALRRRPPPERRAMLRAFIRDAGSMAPPARQLDAYIAMLDGESAGNRASIPLDVGRLELYRGVVHFVGPAPATDAGARIALRPGVVTPLGPGLGQLTLDANWRGAALTIGFRGGGERLGRGSKRPSVAVKTVLREARVLPWMRERVPLVYAGKRLVAVADIAVDESFFVDARLPWRWDARPPFV